MSFWDSLSAGFKVFENVINLLLPVAAIFGPGAALPALAMKVIPKLPALMATADELFTEAGSGAVKKNYVMDMAAQLAGVASDLSTGGQKETWDKEIAPNLSVLVDATVAVANTVRAGTVVDDTNTLTGKNAQ